MYNDADPYAYDLNDVQEDEEGVPLGRSLVIQTFLLTPRVEYGDQRNEIFRARCPINKRVCDLIIDSGSVIEHCIEEFGYQAGTENIKASLSVQDRLD